MRRLRRSAVALMAPLVLMAAPAPAQEAGARLVSPMPAAGPEAAYVRPPEFRIVEDPSRPGERRPDGLIAAWPVSDNLTVGVGRYAVPRIARPRTNMEAERNPTGVRDRDRGIAAVGFSLRF